MLIRHLRSATALFVILTALTGILYPGLVTVAAQLLFPGPANGSLVVTGGGVAGSSLIGQGFTSPRYFWGRPSATPGGEYNAAASSGSNYGPLNPALTAAAAGRASALRSADPSNAAPIPVDLLTASGSGLDPHISPAAAQYQAARVARERNVSLESVRSLIELHTEGRALGFLGEPRVNVLGLNIALDRMTGGGRGQ